MVTPKLPQKRMLIWYILPPAITLALVSPIMLNLPPFWPKNSVNQPDLESWLVVLPFYLGLSATPGYLFALFGNHNRSVLKGWKCYWVELSLILSALSALAGAIIGIMTVIVTPFAFWSCLMAFRLWWLFKKS